jgi:hypothetical protein
MIPVIVESPYAGATDVELNRNIRYLERCLRDCIDRGETPYASHKMLTVCLNDKVPEERALGIAAGLVWRRLAERRVFYIDHGMSRGMKGAEELYEREGLSFVQRSIGAEP